MEGLDGENVSQEVSSAIHAALEYQEVERSLSGHLTATPLLQSFVFLH